MNLWIAFSMIQHFIQQKSKLPTVQENNTFRKENKTLKKIISRMIYWKSTKAIMFFKNGGEKILISKSYCLH